MKLNNALIRTWAVAATLLGACSGAVQAQDALKADGEYLVTVSRPGLLHVIDTQTDTLVRSCEMPGRIGSGHLAFSPDGLTAFVLYDGWENIYGIELDSCKTVFSAKQSDGAVRSKSFASIAVSRDGKEIYSVQNRVRRHSDRFEAMDPVLAVYATDAGMNAKPLRTFPVDRRITTIGATDQGEVILGGADVKAINVTTGETRMVLPTQNWDRPDMLTPDAFAMFNGNGQTDEYVLPYVTARFTDEAKSMENAQWWWGLNRVDLKTGKATQSEVTPFEFIVFNFVADPTNADIIYGAFNTLSRHNIKTLETEKVVHMPHTYYNIEITQDGKKLYVGGTSSDISVHDAATLEKIGSIQLPGDMAAADMRIARAR